MINSTIRNNSLGGILPNLEEFGQPISLKSLDTKNIGKLIFIYVYYNKNLQT